MSTSIHHSARIRILAFLLLSFFLVISQLPVSSALAQTIPPVPTDSIVDQVVTQQDPIPDATPEASSVVIYSLDPAVIVAGGSDLTVTVTGSGFTPSSIVSWNNTSLVTTFINGNSISADIPSDLIRDPGVISVAVTNTDPAFDSSNPILVNIADIDPQPNEKLSTSSVAFDWLDVPGALSYRLQLSASEDFTSLLLDQETQVSAYPTDTSLEPNLVYYWRTSAWDGTNWSEWSSTWSFTSISPPVAPLLLAPLSGAKTAQPTLSWAAVENGAYYRVQISTSNLFDAPLVDVTLPPGALDHTPASLQDGSYYWRVCAYDEVDVQGAWSETWSFKLDTIPPALPVVLKPADGAVVSTTIPKFVVAAVSGARNYHFQVAAEAEFLTLVAENSSVSAVDGKAAYQLTAAEALPFGKLYWRARAVDAAGNPSAWTAIRTITVNILKTPSNKTKTTNQKPTFTWGAVAGAQQYRLQVSTTTDFNAENGDIVRDKVLSAVTSFTPGGALDYGKYYWRMQVQTSPGWSNWTPVFELTVTSTFPIPPALAGPAMGATISDSTPRLRWLESFNIYSPQLRIHDRLIQVYLPPDYHTSGKSYPVIYVQDGVLMFNDSTSDEYRLDETLESLHQSGQLEGVIAVGIECSDNRWDEYSPWINNNLDIWHAWQASKTEGGEGDQYMDFVVNTVKPVIDQRYRTLPDRENTAIGGGSMGGLISLYGGLKRQDVFSKIVAFSPAVWFAESGGTWLSNNRLVNFINSIQIRQDMQVFLYIGTGEWSERSINIYNSSGQLMTYPRIWIEGARVVAKALKTRGLPSGNIFYIENPGGIHLPFSWAGFFDDALLWFFKDQILPDYVPPQVIPAADGSRIVRYQIQVSRTPDFSKIIQTATAEGETGINANVLPGDGKFYWRVRAFNDLDVPGPWSQPRWFTLDTTPPSPTKLVSPAYDKTINTTTPLLKVKYVDGASRYQLQFSTDVEFNSLLFEKTSMAASLQLTAAKALPFGQVYWRARTLDLLGNVSAWTDAGRMNVNVLNSPSDGTVLTDTTPTMSWSPASGALQYRLQVARSADFLEGSGDVILDELLGAATLRYSPQTPLAYGRYYWRLQVNTAKGWSNWTPVFAFDLSTKPVAPVNLSPINKEVVPSSTPTLTWEEVTDPVVPVTGYLVQISYSSVFSPIKQTGQVTSAAYTTTALANGRYYWRVRAINALGIKGKWSTTGVFKVLAVP